MIELKNIYKTYKSKKGINTKALDNISLKLPDTGFVFIVGKSGSGKSTLLNIISGLDKEDSGEIIVDGKSLKRFKSKDYDYYRNKYIGFVFQEFNLINEYNVYDNILLSLKLQKKKASKEDCDTMLSNLGLENLGNRKVYELSGGQKQRVSIARALIKNPKVLIADEPTGSLDQESGKQIFEILKKISKDKLVIVVSHDIESAKMYGDNIIEISDGHIIYDTTSKDIVNINSFSSTKSTLPLKDKLKFAFLNLGRHKIRLVFTILLICASITFFQISKNISNIDIYYTHAKALKDLGHSYINIGKFESNGNDFNYYERFYSNEDRKKILNNIDSEYLTKYKVQENGVYLELDYNTGNMTANNGFSRDAYYYHDSTEDKFVIASDNYLKNKKIIGRLPKEKDEIMIHSYLAEVFMKVGIAEYIEPDENNIVKHNYYYPKSYEELLKDEKYIKFGDKYKLKIVGILEDDLKDYEYIKNLESLEAMYDNNNGDQIIRDKKFQKFLMGVVEPSYEIYVSDEFIKNENYIKNSKMTDTILIVKTNTDSNLYSRSSHLNGRLSYFDGKEFIETETLNDNEIILNPNYLNIISNGEYNKKLEEYISNYEKENKPKQEEKLAIQKKNDELLEQYQKKLDKLLKDQENGLRLDETLELPKFEKIPNFIYKDSETLTKEFFLDYIKDKDIIGNNISIEFIMKDTYTKVSEYDELFIKGISLISDIIFLSDNIGKEAITDNVVATELKIYEPNEVKMYKLLQKYPIATYERIELPEFQSNSFISTTIAGFVDFVKSYSKLTLYISIVFALFAFILITNFIIISIIGNKKTIGILRALGTKKIDIFEIFLNQSLIIYVVSFILSVLITFILKGIGNSFISNYYNYEIELFLYSYQNILITLGVLLVIIFLSNLFSIHKIASMKPVDSINEK